MKMNSKIWHNPMILTGSVILLFISIMALFAPVIAPNNPDEIHLDSLFLPADAAYPLGTDYLGRCNFSRLIIAGRHTLGAALLIESIVLIAGVIMGGLAGYFKGWLDKAVISIIDVLLAFPGIILAMVIAGMLGPGMKNLIIAVSAVHWIGYARIVRNMVMSVKEKEFVKASISVGSKNVQIIFRHIIPNIIPFILVYATLDLGSLILNIAGLSFLGLGIQPPTAEWGSMLNEARPYFREYPRLMLLPGAAILIVGLAFQLIGEGLRDIMNPRACQLGLEKRMLEAIEE
jgi:peptide/nickel transport system permease protein